MNNIRIALRALRHRNFRLFYLGQGISLIGTWMQSVAASWLVYKMTGSPLMLGVVAFSGQIPAFLFSPVAGVLSDRISRKRILVFTQIAALVQAVSLAAITLAGVIEVWHIAVLSFFLGLINAFDMPTRQAFVVEMVEDKSDLVNAIALNSTLFNASRLIGPALAGILINISSEGICFLVNGISYFAAIAALAAMNIRIKPQPEMQPRLFPEIRNGFIYVIGMIPIRDLLILVFMMSLIGMTFPVLLPVFATTILHGGSHTYGFLVASSGIGAISGTIFLAFRKSVLGLGRIIAITAFVLGLGLLGLSFSTITMLTMAFLAMAGFGMIVNIASCNSIMQTIVDESMRGRVMSFYTMSFMGAAPLGSLLAGGLSDSIGAPKTAIIGGSVGILTGLIFLMRLPLMRKMIRPIYREIGIIPQVALGLQTASELRNPPEYSGN